MCNGMKLVLRQGLLVEFIRLGRLAAGDRYSRVGGGWFLNKAVGWRRPLIDLGVHMLDAVMWLLDYPEPV